MSPIELHVLPKLGKIPVTEIDQSNVKRVLEPLWHTKPDTARKTASRLNYIIKYAAASKLKVDLGAVDSAKLLLGDRNHVAENIVAMDWPEVPAFYQSLEDHSVPHLGSGLITRR